MLHRNGFCSLNTDFDVCTVLLSKHAGLLHPLNVHHVKLLDLAFESAINVGKWSDACNFGLQLVPGLRRYNGALSPILAVLHLKLGKLLLLVDRFAEAKQQLIDAGEIMQYTHGKMALQRSQWRPLMKQADAALSSVDR